LKDTIIGFGRAAATGCDRHFFPMHGMPRDRCVDDSTRFFQSACYEYQIKFQHGSAGKLSREAFVRHVIFRDHQATARFFIKPVHDPRSLLATDA